MKVPFAFVSRAISVYAALFAERFTLVSATLPTEFRFQPEIVPSREQNRKTAGWPFESRKLPAGAPETNTVPVGEPVPVPDAGGMVALNWMLPEASVT